MAFGGSNQPQIAVLNSRWMQVHGISQSLLQRNANAFEITANSVIERLLPVEQQLTLLIPAHTDDAGGGYRYVRQARRTYNRNLVRIILLTDFLNEVLRKWNLKQGADLVFELPEEKRDFLQSVCPQTTINESVAVAPRFTPSFLEELSLYLTEYVGPIATILVNDAAEIAESEEHLYSLLSESIDDKEARTAFATEVFGR